MTRASGGGDPTVPISSAIIETLKVDGAQSASTLARRLQLRKADVLASCRALAAATQIRRLGKRWALRPPVRCAALNKAGQPCARFAAPGSAFCTQHKPDVELPLVQGKPVSPRASIVEPPSQKKVRTDVASPTVRRDDVPTEPETPDNTPELFVRGHRVTEADVIQALSMLGDEQVEAYRDGRLPKVKAYRIARNRLRTIARMT